MNGINRGHSPQPSCDKCKELKQELEEQYIAMIRKNKELKQSHRKYNNLFNLFKKILKLMLNYKEESK